MASTSSEARAGASAALVISSVGLALQALAGILALWYWSWYRRGPFFMGPWMMGGYYGAPPGYGPRPIYAPYPVLYAALVAVVLVLGAIGVAMMGSDQPERSRIGAVLTIVAAVIAFPTMFGLIVGSLLMLIGGVLGLVELRPS